MSRRHGRQGNRNRKPGENIAMQFILIAHDRSDGADLRKRIRPDHLAYAAEHIDHFVYGGPLLDAAGNLRGSVIVYEAPDRKAAEALVANDPYVKEGLFGHTELSAFRTVVRDGRITP